MFRWLISLFQPAGAVTDRARAHLTFRHSSLGRTARRTGQLLRRQIWLWPVFAVILLAIVGYTVSSMINRIMVQSLQSELVTVLSVEKAMLLKWFKVQESNALRLASEPQVRSTIQELLASVNRSSPNFGSLNQSDEPTSNTTALHYQLQDQLATTMTSNNFVGYIWPTSIFRLFRRKRRVDRQDNSTVRIISGKSVRRPDDCQLAFSQRG